MGAFVSCYAEAAVTSNTVFTGGAVQAGAGGAFVSVCYAKRAKPAISTCAGEFPRRPFGAGRTILTWLCCTLIHISFTGRTCPARGTVTCVGGQTIHTDTIIGTDIATRGVCFSLRTVIHIVTARGAFKPVNAGAGEGRRGALHT